MTDISNMRLVDWLDDLCVRFIINLPHEELLSVERICFQIEEAQWFYEDFLRPLDPSLPSMNLRRFALLMFQHCPLSANYSEDLHLQAYENFLAYKTRVPVRGAIMLNDDMTHAVLVKGWKKGAKWSFPRGKINKEEANLDCAVREVYEETGYDLKQAGLVGPDEQMKQITVSMREQEMMLYVFRGVPMDTYFEPRTRKEISKIDWYKLTDLPTIRRNKHAQQGGGQDLIKENNFYMVAPFLGPLKGWIKQQQRLDRHKAKAGANLAPPIATGVTDTELEADVGETTADEAPIPEDNLANLVAKLGQGHRASDTLPEVSVQPQEQALDPAAELKRLLSVGAASPMQSPPAENQAQANPLLAMLRGSGPTPQQPPRTPLDQFMSPPAQPRSPHGQHHPRPPQLDHMSPPPPFPFPSHHNLPFRGPQQHHPRMPQHPHHLQQHHNGPPMPFPRHSIPPPPHQTHQIFPGHSANVPRDFSQQAQRPYQQTGDPQFAYPPQFSDVHGPRIPNASNLPATKLTAHALGLLESFKSLEKQTPPVQPASLAAQSSQATPRVQQPPQIHEAQDSFVSPRQLPVNAVYAPSPPPLQSVPPHANFQPAQPKPRNAHQDSLLSLFRSPSATPATPEPPPAEEGPIELSAQPTTPGYSKLQQAYPNAGVSRPELSIQPNLPDAFGQQPRSGLTSATVSGPVNVPDFETVKKRKHLDQSNEQPHSRGPSPSQRKSADQNPFIPQQILRRTDAPAAKNSPTELGPNSKNASPTVAKPPASQNAAFAPQILRRPQQSSSPAPPSAAANPLLALFGAQASPQPVAVAPSKSPAPSAPSAQQSFDRRETLPTDQKNALLSLFGKPSQIVSSPVQTSAPRVPLKPSTNPSLASGLPRTGSPAPPSRSPQPPTPKNLMSGVISPVSPLPGQNSQMNSPANPASRSRISSIGESMAPNIVIPTSHPVQKNGVGNAAEEGYTSTTSIDIIERVGSTSSLGVGDAGKARQASATSPVDKSFLLGFLENVAKSGR